MSSQDLEAFKTRLNGQPLALVPTMGALHDGHLTLTEKAKARGFSVMVSIFVNPRQFNNPLDLDKYPRTLETDIDKLSSVGVDAVYIPKYEDVYRQDQQDVALNLGSLDELFEGFYRPGHFDGVVQVLYRFFIQIQPNAVFFGEKDLQQCMVVKRLIAAYFPFIQYNQIPTVREKSGLAMSSRNQRLSADGKEKAACIFRVLSVLKRDCEKGQFPSEKAIQELKSHSIETEYLEWVEMPTLTPMELDANRKASPPPQQAIIFAGYLEGVRLIDNLVF